MVRFAVRAIRFFKVQFATGDVAWLWTLVMAHDP